MKRQCVITGEQFESDDSDASVAPNTIRAIVTSIRSDRQVKEEVISAIVQDQQFINMISKAVLNAKANDVGLCCPGTIAEFFRRVRSDLAAKKTRKVAK